MNLKYLFLLMKKEILQISRDKSIFAIAILLPIMLTIIYGSTLRMDVKPVTIAYVTSEESSITIEIGAALKGSQYLKVSEVKDLTSAQELMRNHKVKAYLYLDNNFTSSFLKGRGTINLAINGSESQASSVSEGYILQALNSVLLKYSSKSNLTIKSNLREISINSRSWFNEANESTWFLMSGQYIGIITVMCAFLACFVISREWDRGTIESLSASNASALEIVLSKVLVYFLLGIIGMIVMLVVGQTCYQIPIRGSFIWLILNMVVYTFEMICLGTMISALSKSQFLSVEYAIVVGFLPAVMLSGLIFDLRGVAEFIRIISNFLPPTYAIESNRIIFLSGGNTDILIRNLLIQIAFIILLLVISVRKVKKDIK